jgi:hypothetical protein
MISDLVDVSVEPVGVASPHLYRLRMTCSGDRCSQWSHGFPALPSTAVTVTKLLQVAAEHIGRSHPEARMPEVPLLNVEVPREPVIPPLSRVDAIGPIGE